MHYKLGLLAAVAASASAATSTENEGQIHQLRHFEVNNQICITEKPYTFCKNGFKPMYEEKQSMPMLCVDRDDPIVPSMEQIVQTGHRMRKLRNRATERVMKVEKVIHCEPTRLTITDAEPMEFNSRSSYEGNTRNNMSLKYRASSPETKREITGKLTELKTLVPDVLDSIQLNKDEYEKVFQLAIELNKYEQVQKALFQFNKQLPALYVQAVQHVQKPLIFQYDDTMVNTDSVKVLKELKELAYRVYVYTIVKLAEHAHQSSIEEPLEFYKVIEELERIWYSIQNRIPQHSSTRIEDWLRLQLPQIQQQLQNQVQYDDLVLPTTSVSNASIIPSFFSRSTYDKMSKEQKERLQVVLEKILLGSIQLANQVEKGSGTRLKSSLFDKMFNKQPSPYKQLIEQSKNKFDFIQ